MPHMLNEWTLNVFERNVWQIGVVVNTGVIIGTVTQLGGRYLVLAVNAIPFESHIHEVDEEDEQNGCAESDGQRKVGRLRRFQGRSRRMCGRFGHDCRTRELDVAVVGVGVPHRQTDPVLRVGLQMRETIGAQHVVHSDRLVLRLPFAGRVGAQAPGGGRVGRLVVARPVVHHFVDDVVLVE